MAVIPLGVLPGSVLQVRKNSKKIIVVKNSDKCKNQNAFQGNLPYSHYVHTSSFLII